MRIKPYSPWPMLLALPIGILAAFMARYAVLLPVVYDSVVDTYPVLRIPFLASDMPGLATMFGRGLALGAIVLTLASLVALLVRRLWALRLFQRSLVAAYAVFVFFVMMIGRMTGLVMDEAIPLGGASPTPVALFFWRQGIIGPWVWVLLGVGLVHLLSWRRAVLVYYSGIHEEAPAPGDKIIDNVLSNGRDPQFRKSMIGSFGLHFLIIIVIPWLLSIGPRPEDYRIQQGSGTPEVTVVAPKVLKQKKKKKPKKKLIVNPNSAISFYIPTLDDSPTAQEVEKESQVTYVADPNRVFTMTSGSGKIGTGGGKTGGWPDGSKNAKFRFIRLEYNGPGWDDGMDEVSRADKNFLEQFRKLTELKTAENSESHSIATLKRYNKGFAPPFVYMTGHGAINVSSGDAKILRDYMLDGGMLFADCGSPHFDQAFRGFIQTVLPGQTLRVIADDDPIFQVPFTFANGAPPLWHHGGMRAMGIKHNDRWVVFYHPGDINDAWKTGHSGMSDELTQGAFEMGVNIVYYSFTHYLEMTRKYRK